MVVGSNLCKNELNFLFAKFSFGKNMKGERNPSCKIGNLGAALGREVIKATIISIDVEVSGQFGGETKEHLWGARNKLGVFELSKD